MSSIDRVISAETESAEEEAAGHALRPQALEGFIGQPKLCQRLGVAVESARRRNVPLDHVLLSGPPGVGKTSIAHIVATEMGSSLVSTSGPVMDKIADLLGMLTSIPAGTTVFIDEIHRMPRNVEECLYSAMEDFRVDLMLPGGTGGSGAAPVSFPLKPFTLVGATTRKGMLTAPLRDRFGLSFELDFYTPEDLALIVSRSARLLHMDLSGDAAFEIGRRSRGTPRIANRLLRRVMDYAVVHDTSECDHELVTRALVLEGVDHAGMDDLDRNYLRVLLHNYSGGPAGLNAIAASMQQDSDTLEDAVEPFLLHQGYINRTASGRRATRKAYEHMESAL